MQTKIFATILILTLTAATIISVFVLGSMDHSQTHTCPVANMSDGACPPSDNPVAVISHHLSGVKTFSQTVFGFNINVLAFLLLTLLLSTFVIWFASCSNNDLSNSVFIHRTCHRFGDLFNNQQRQLLCWFALHNKQDPYALQWMYSTI